MLWLKRGSCKTAICLASRWDACVLAITKCWLCDSLLLLPELGCYKYMIMSNILLINWLLEQGCDYKKIQKVIKHWETGSALNCDEINKAEFLDWSGFGFAFNIVTSQEILLVIVEMVPRLPNGFDDPRTVSPVPPWGWHVCLLVQFLNNCRMDCHEIRYKYPWSPEDESHWLFH